MLKSGLIIAALIWIESSTAATPWQLMTQPIAGPANAIGSFTNGCIVGAQALPLESPYYQVMRQDQRRYFGHPDLLAFIQRYSQQVAERQMGTVMIGDMGMVAGGRFSRGHASHQTGLDVDIWLQLPKQRWSSQQLLHPQPLDLVRADDKGIVPGHWTEQVGQMIKLAAEDPDVRRIFVNPAIKQQLCLEAGPHRSWLNKVRPWFAHRAHMHVRLRCPDGATECIDQPAPPPGDGCGAELKSWFLPSTSTSKPLKRNPPIPPATCQMLIKQQ